MRPQPLESGERRTPWESSQELHFYLSGRTPFFASRDDQRFSWCLYVPSGRNEEQGTWPLAIVVHGTERSAEGYRDAFAEFGETHGCIIMAPLFPCGIEEPLELHNYKWLEYKGLRFDLILLKMIDEVSELYSVKRDRFLLHGFSGGGHFVHRFLYLHPDRVLGASIGAPGVVTLLDQERDWWVGVRDVKDRFGRELCLASMKDVAVQMVIGSEDKETWEIALSPKDARWMEGANDAGRTRIERLDSLRRSFETAGVSVRYDVIPGVAHDGFAVLEPVRDFFGSVLVANGLSATAKPTSERQGPSSSKN